MKTVITLRDLHGIFFHTCNLFSMVRVSWWVGGLGALPFLLGLVSHRQNVRQNRICQEKAAWELTAVPFIGLKSHGSCRRRKESLFSLRTHYLKHTSRISIPSSQRSSFWAIHKANIIEQNGTLESTSRQRLMNNVLHRIKEDLLPPQSTPEETGPHMELVSR